MGGTLSSSRALLNTDLKKPKLSYEGTKKVNGREAFVLSYSPKNGSDLTIKMYFDNQNYRHIRTEYSRVIGAVMGSNVDSSAGRSDSRYRVVEDFSDFQKAGNLTLPGTYKFSYSFFGSGSTQFARNPNRELELKFSLTNFSFNDPLDVNAFNIAAK